MRRGSKITNKKVWIPDEDEAEQFKRTEAKKAAIQAEFEKHKKELEINISEESKSNELKLKQQLQDIIARNETKREKLKHLENINENLDKRMTEESKFLATVSKFEMSKTNEAYLSVEFHPNRTTSSIMNVKGINLPEIADKQADLLQTLTNIELLIEQENDKNASIQEKYEELKRNQVLLNKKINELQKMNEHGNKRFTDLQQVEFIARNKQAAITSDLKEVKEGLREAHHQESEYKKQKEENKKKEIEYLNLKQNEIANILVELDIRRQELQQTNEEVKNLEFRQESMREKRKNTRIVTKYIEALNALDEEKANLTAIHQVLKEMPIDTSRETSSNKRHSTVGSRKMSPTILARNSLKVFKTDQEGRMIIKKNSFAERNHYVEKLQKFYENHPEGPETFADSIIQKYMELSYQEESLKSYYEELQDEKKKKDTELECLENNLIIIKDKNEYITMGRTGSKILESNEQEAIDSGMLVVETLPTTLNQAKFDFENKKEADNQAILLTSMETFVMKCYMDSVEMISRLSKMISSIQVHSGGHLSNELKEIVRAVRNHMTTLKKIKKTRQEATASRTTFDGSAEGHKINNNNSEKDKEQEVVIILDLQDVYEAFLSMFEEYPEKAVEFVSQIKNDVIINTFITIEDIKNYLQACQTDFFIESQIQKSFNGLVELRKTGIEKMIKNFETIYNTYAEIIKTTQQSKDEVASFLKAKDVKVIRVDLLRANSEPTLFVKKAIQKKWQVLLERYNYNPSRDFRKEDYDIAPITQNISPKLKQNAEEPGETHKEFWDNEDLKAKLNEIAGADSKKDYGYKGKKEEDKKRLQAKREKEKEKQAVENMGDDDFVDWQRKQFKKDSGEQVIQTEINEGQSLRKAQVYQAIRLSSQPGPGPGPLEELKKMIQSSKMLSKIQIIEKKRSSFDIRKGSKHESMRNYISFLPKRNSKPTLQSANQSYNIMLPRQTLASSSKLPESRFFGASSDRMSETENGDSSKDSFFKAHIPTSASKFKTEHQVDVSSEVNFHYEKSPTNGKNRTYDFENLKKWPKKNQTNQNWSKDQVQQSPLQKFQIKNRSQEREKQIIRIDKSLRKEGIKKEVQPNKNKPRRLGLPKLEKSLKIRETASKQKKSIERILNSHENINEFIGLNTDPSLRVVYSPKFFTNSFSGSVLSGDELDYKFDSYKFKVPGSLISDKI